MPQTLLMNVLYLVMFMLGLPAGAMLAKWEREQRTTRIVAVMAMFAFAVLLALSNEPTPERVYAVINLILGVVVALVIARRLR